MASSEKKDKQIWHKAFRRSIKTNINTNIDDVDETIFPKEREIVKRWAMSKEGKSFYWTELELRKLINSKLKELALGKERYHYSWFIKGMCQFFNIKNPVGLIYFSDRKINEFIEYVINKEKRK